MRLLLLCALALSTWGATVRGQATYTLTASQVAGNPGETVELIVTADATGDIAGFQVSLEHDPTVATVTSVELGNACYDFTDPMNPTPSFDLFSTFPPTGGFSGVEVLVIPAGFSSPPIPAGTSLELLRVSYQLAGSPGSSAVSFWSDPPVPTRISDSTGVAYSPTPSPGSLTVRGGPAPNYDLSLTSATGYPFQDLTLTVQADATAPIAGFTISVQHDDAVAAVVGASLGADALDLTDPQNPIPLFDLAVELNPTGFTGAMVVATPLGGESVPAGADLQLLELTYRGVQVDDSTSVDFLVTGPNPTTVNAVGGAGYLPTVSGGTVTIELPPQPIAECVRTETQRVEYPGPQQESQFFGLDVAISGDWAVAGAPQSNAAATDGGAAYVYRRDGSAWVLHQELVADPPTSSALFGYSVGVDGNVIVVGAYQESGQGAAHIYRLDGTTWNHEARLDPPTPGGGNRYGYSVDVSGDRVLVSEELNDDFGVDAGAAFVYRYDSPSWTLEQQLVGLETVPGDVFGYRAALDDDQIVVGSRWADVGGVVRAGAAYVFRRIGTTWVQEARLTAATPQFDAQFGSAVDVRGDLVVVGAWMETTFVEEEGTATVFRKNGLSWDLEQTLSSPFPGSPYDEFGYSVAVDGNVVVVGARRALDSAGTRQGAVYVYRHDGLTWAAQYNLNGSGLTPSDFLGQSVALEGSRLLAGASSAPVSGLDEVGACFAYPILFDDCDTNGVLDLCEIEDGIFTDCNDNGVIDLCETTLAPVIVSGPDPVAGCLGEPLSLGVQLDGVGPFTYQWYLDGAPLLDQTGPTLEITSLGVTDAGAYSVEVTNGCGSATSSSATVTVDLCATLIARAEDAAVPLGATFDHFILGTYSIELGAYSVAVQFSSADLQVATVDLASTVASTADFSDTNWDNMGGWITAGIVMDTTAPITETLFPATDAQILRTEFMVDPQTASASTLVEPVLSVGTPEVDTVYSTPGGVSLTPVLAPGTITITGVVFRRGDCNGDQSVDLGDAVAALGGLFGPEAITCEEPCDGNDDGLFNIADAVYILAYLFSAGAPPPPPFPDCGVDPTPDGVTCEAPPACN